MNLSDFQQRYGLFLLPYGDTGVILGDKVHNPRFGDPNMPGKNVVYDLKEHGVITGEEEKELIRLLKNKERGTAEFGQITIREQVHDKVDLKIPGIGDLSGQLDHTRNIQYEFSDITVRELDNETRSETLGEGLALALEKKLEAFRKKDEEDYKAEFRRGWLDLGWVSIVTKLVYGKVNLKADRDMEGDLAVAVDRVPVEARYNGKSEDHISYQFDSTEVPFAMQVEKIGAFN